ncbi:MAG: conjugal transfer protein TraG N-terminal domain-containing protein, partial [Sutterella sp.]|nr:conjugal transfer protein TraG N-terminal domain-containing protein [Sutterella sp.]
MEAYDFYAYWNGREVAELWTVIAAITSTDDYRTLIVAVMTGGFLAVMIGAAVRNRGMDAVTWFAATILIFSMAYFPRVTISVKDVRAGYTQAVEGVPLGIGWPASVTSRVSWWLTQTFETAFQDVDAASFSRFGVAFPQRAVSALMAMGPVTEKGRESLRAVTERCIVPEMLDSPVKRRALLEAPDIYLLVSEKDWVNPARRVVLDGSVVTCADALPILTQYLSETEIPAMENMLLTKLEAGGDEIASAAFLAALPGAEELMLGTSRTLTESLRQSLMMSVIPDATLSAAAKAGKAPLSTGVALARAQGNLASEINYRTLADMAKSALPKVRNVLEFIVIGLFPIVLLMMAGLGLGGLTVFRAYLTLLISVALWAPITAIINFLTIHVDAEPMNRLVEAAGGVTLSAATLIREAGASSQAMAGSLMWLVPVLAYAVAKGSDMAITSMASSVLAPAASAAQSQGSAIAMGNVSAGNASVGNTSVNNTTGNKSDMSSSYASPNMHRSTMAEGSWQGNLATGTITAMSVAETNLGITSQGGLSYGVSMAAVQASSSGASYVSASGYGETTGTSSTSMT